MLRDKFSTIKQNQLERLILQEFEMKIKSIPSLESRMTLLLRELLLSFKQTGSAALNFYDISLSVGRVQVIDINKMNFIISLQNIQILSSNFRILQNELNETSDIFIFIYSKFQITLKKQRIMHKKKAKVLVIGDASSGKSSLIQSYVKKNYQLSSEYTMTQGAEIYSKIIPFPQSNVDIQLFLFDLSGHQFYQSIALGMSKNPDLVMVTYDCTNQQSLTNSLKWLDKVKKLNNKSSLNGVLVATKCESPNCKQVSSKEGQDYARKLNLDFFQVSASYKTNVQKPFLNLAQKVIALSSTSFS